MAFIVAPTVGFGFAATSVVTFAPRGRLISVDLTTQVAAVSALIALAAAVIALFNARAAGRRAATAKRSADAAETQIRLANRQYDMTQLGLGRAAFNSLLKASYDYYRFTNQVIRDRHVDPYQTHRILEDDPVHHPTFTLLVGSVRQDASLAQSIKKLGDTGVGMSVLAILAICDISFDGWDQVPAKAKAVLNMDVDDKAFFRAIQQFESDGVQYFSGELRRLFAEETD